MTYEEGRYPNIKVILKIFYVLVKYDNFNGILLINNNIHFFNHSFNFLEGRFIPRHL